MSFSMQKLRSLLPRSQHSSSAATAAAKRHSVSVEPEIGFQITIEASQQHTSVSTGGIEAASNGCSSVTYQQQQQKTFVPELNVHLIAARHLPALFGFKVVQGYLIKVKLFPGSKRLDSSIQTNSWPKFNENFKFPLAPDIKSSLKQHSRRGSRPSHTDFTPEEIFEGQFVVFTIYALLELPPASFNRLNKTYRSLRDKSSNLVQKVVENSSNKTKDDKENSNGTQKIKRKPSDINPRDAMPPLTISESRRNIGAVTCYLEPKLFKRNARTGLYSTEEIWLPIKDITTTVVKSNNNNLTNAPKGIVELVLEVRDLNTEGFGVEKPATPTESVPAQPHVSGTNGVDAIAPVGGLKHPQWSRMTSEMKRKMGISNAKLQRQHDLELRVTTARMRCSNKVKDELESTAGSVYVKTTVFEHGIYTDSWKSSTFYPSLSTNWDVIDAAATLIIPLQQLADLENILVRTTLATKTKIGKKLVLGTVLVSGAAATGTSGAEHMQLLRESPLNERVPLWHCYQ